MRKQGFVTGALILMAANAVSKILGAVFKIPLTYILEEEGMAVYNTAFQVYIMFLSFIISGFPFAVSKTVAEACALKRPARAARIVGISSLMLSGAGLAGSAALYFFAPYLAAAMKEAGAADAIRAIAPSVFFVAAGTAYKSYFHGVSDMVPIAFSQVVEAVIKLAVGYMLALYFVRLGKPATSAGAIFGVTIGEALATALLAAWYFKAGRINKSEKCGGAGIIRDLFSIAAPLVAVSAAGNALSMAETALTRGCLLRAGLAESEARFMYGAYTGYAQTVFHLPSGILATVGVSILPVIAGAVVQNDMSRARRTADFALYLVTLLSLPCAVVMYTLPEELLNSLFKNASSAVMLKLMAPCIVPLCVSQLITSVLQSAGKIGAPFAVMVISSAVRLAVCAALVPMPEFNIYGAIAAAGAGMFLSMLLLYAVLKKFLGLRINFSRSLLKPAAAAALMAFTALTVKRPLTARFGTGFVSFCAAAGTACAVYAAALAVMGGADVREIQRAFKM